ncbi:MAG: zinc ribbon domain-containing protein [Propionivibrio sp.]
MSYVYNSRDSRLDFPNPYRIENVFYFIAAAILIVAALILLMTARGSLSSGSAIAMTPLGLGVVLLIKGITFAARAMSRLRFFFGRGEPSNLAPSLAPDEAGSTPEADHLRQLLRHSSLSFQEPTGALNGSLYSLIPNLIYAPQRIQLVAQRQFQNALAIGVSLLSLLVSLIGTGSEASGWLGLFYFALALFFLLKPLDVGALGRSSLGFKGLVVLILIAILGPVVIPLVTKGSTLPGWLPGLGQAALLMVVTEIAIGLFFLAVMKQTISAPPEATMAMVQGTLTMNSHPKQVQDELERRQQEQWVASLPNRRYARTLPVVTLNAQSGSFAGELIEETQPLPRSEMQHLSLASSFSEARYRWLAWLNTYGVGVLTIAAVALIGFALTFHTPEGINPRVASAATLGLALIIVGNFCFRAGGILWGRFDFISKLIWVEMNGNYQAAHMNFGNQFTDRVKTQKQVINVESMTLRVWIAELESVAFGKDTLRSIVGMRGLKDEAEALHAHLQSFGQQQSMIVAPTSGVDMQRAQALGMMNEATKAKSPEAGILPAPVALAIASVADQPPTAEAGCTNCGAAIENGAAFCAQCGTRLGT